MKLTTGRYTAILSVQCTLLVIDWIINICSLLTRENNALMLILFIVQDACLILALSALLLTFFSTYVFQTGLVYLLYERFRATLLMCIVYFGLTTIVHIWSLITRWSNLKHSWSLPFLTVFILQRFLATVYYYCYKRAALRISDPRFYEDIEIETNKNHQINGQITQ
ncbi:transmembrane protein 138 [Anoplophora glabripennis]|uniref:transmembrane protein 138 n=1 Tax=Anoplophora glabripennis TaxID=217634 RepID=UPI000874DAF2|nr:transmembrane protein 138 [Anoplophora glabripennis]